MIARLTGTVVEKTLTHVVLDVGGVGYLVAVRSTAGFALEKAATLHTHLAVRENALDLYGFETRDACDMFELLMTIPKIGPKTALQILIQADVALIRKAVAMQDATYLTKMSGIGKKSAEKIVAGLKDFFEGDLGAGSGAEHAGKDADIIDALVALGYTQKDARDALLKVAADVTDTNARIKEALKKIS